MGNYVFRFAHLSSLLVLLCIIFFVVIIRYYFYKPIRYRYSLVEHLSIMGFVAHQWRKWVIYSMRFGILIVLALLIARPQLVDTQSKVTADGVDIMLLLDVSDSMREPSESEKIARIDVAKQEAIRFISKRVDDTIGLVLFGRDVLVRCPLTYDKHILQNIVSEVQLGMVDGGGTVLARAIISGVNNLKKGKASTKIIILLTDGVPTQDDLSAEVAIQVANHMGIKIYTIGIGLNYMYHPFFGLVKQDNNQAKELLRAIASETGGQFFLANNVQDMRMVYDKIDALERTAHEVPVFTHYKDLYLPGLISIIIAMIGELWLTTCIWFSI